MYVCIHNIHNVCMYVYTQTHTYTHTHTHVYICTYMYMYTHTHNLHIHVLNAYTTTLQVHSPLLVGLDRKPHVRGHNHTHTHTHMYIYTHTYANTISTYLTHTRHRFILPYSWGWTESLMFGGIISATDPVSVIALVKELGVIPDFGVLIEGESILNDGTSMIVYELCFAILFEQASTVSFVSIHAYFPCVHV